MDKEILDDMREQYPNFSDESLEKLYLYSRVESGEASSLEMVRLSLLVGMISEDQFAEYLEIEKECLEEAS